MLLKNDLFVCFVLCSFSVQAGYKSMCQPFASGKGVNMEKKVFSMIDQSKKSIYLAMYTFTDLRAACKLADAKKRGVQVNVLLDKYSIERRNSIQRWLQRYKVPCVVYHSANSLQHNKYMVVDGRRTLIGSLNFTEHAYKHNCESYVLIENVAVAKFYEKNFQEMKLITKEQDKMERKRELELLKTIRKNQQKDKKDCFEK